MDATLVTMHGVVLGAALLQAATGIGFGVIAGPVILLALNSGSAIQVSALLSLLIAAILAPGLWRLVDRPILARLLLGTLIGLPIGIAIFVFVSIDVLKLLAGLSVAFIALSASGLTVWDSRQGRTSRGRFRHIGIGVLSGAMSSSLAMPGPVVAGRLSVLAVPNDVIRATILVMFLFSYPAAIAVQAGAVGVTRDTLLLTASLAPATLIGVGLGHVLGTRIGEAVFRRLILIILLATAVSLLGNAALSLVGGGWGEGR